MLAYRVGDYDAAVRYSEECAAIARQLGDHTALAEAWGNLGFIAYRRDDDRALPLLTESLAAALNRIGIVRSYRGDFAAAMVCYEECLALHRQRGNRRSIANALDNLACGLRRRGDYAGATARSEESLVMFRALNDR